jgi:DNA/RNA-binding domain of Phe-tRNA-synthetase-like protein
LIRQAGTLVRAALDQAGEVDRGQIEAQLAEAEAARLRAEALAAAATARAIAAQQQVDALTEALAATREEARAAREELRRRAARHGRLRPAGTVPADHGAEGVGQEA